MLPSRVTVSELHCFHKVSSYELLRVQSEVDAPCVSPVDDIAHDSAYRVTHQDVVRVKEGQVREKTTEFAYHGVEHTDFLV